MDYTTLVQQVLNGLTIGFVYALVALGYTMVYGVLRMINFAHGELFMLGAYLFLTFIAGTVTGQLFGSVALSVVVFVLIVMGLVALLGTLVERVAYRPLRHSTRLSAVVSAPGMSVFLQNAVMLVYGARQKVYPTEQIVPRFALEFGGIEISAMQLIIFVLSIALMVGLQLFVLKTQTGTAVRAVSQDHDASRLMGIDVDRIIVLIFMIGPALGAAAGVMVGMYYRQITFFIGWTYGLKAFIAAVFGGIGNIPGAMIGGILLGVVETLAAGYVSAGWKDAIAFFLLILILIVRPTGLLGERVAEKL